MMRRGLSIRSRTRLIGIALALAFVCHGPAQFEDISAGSGLDAPLVSGSAEKRYILESMGGGVGFIDFDDDGWIDIYLVNGAVLDDEGEVRRVASDRLYRNNRDGTFADVTAGAGLGDPSWGMGVAVADVDGNGFPDLYITNYGPNRLYLNRGDGTFSETARAAGVAGAEWSSSAAFADYDGDGDVDLYVSNYLEFSRSDPSEDSLFCRYRGIRVQCGPRGMIPTADRLYENLGDGRFEDVTEASGMALAPDSYGLGVIWADYDDDGDPDLYVANDSTSNFLFRNNGDKSFEEAALVASVALSEDGKEQAGMGVDFGDYDNDGDLDLIVTNFSDDYNTLYRNLGDGEFADISYRVGLGESTWALLGWGAQFADVDRDGFLDIAVANGHVYPELDGHEFGVAYRQPNAVFMNRKADSFKRTDLPPAAPHQSSRGLAVGDIDNDGAVDLLIANLDATPTLLRGRPSAGHWLLLDLRGAPPNRSAIGARAVVKTGDRTQTRYVRSGGSYQSQSDLRLHFGLGGDTVIDEIRVHWPNGREQVLETVEADQILRIEQQ